MRLPLVVLALAALTAACGGDERLEADGKPEPATESPSPAAAPTPAAPQRAQRPPEPGPGPAAAPRPLPTPDRPAWLGTRELPVGPDGFAVAQPTPEGLVDRRLPPPEGQPLGPADDGAFRASIEAVPAAVAERSTWRPECPVDLDELRYVTVVFWGFDDRPHHGELLVHADAAEDVAWVFEQLYEARFPIEEMRIVAEPELDAPPTGDGNNTTAFVCRPAVGSERWSDHAHGLAVDVNPFLNPYERGELVLPELASAYTDRDDHRPGMVQPGDVVVESFAEIGWGWGGDWSSAKDWMHFSASGR